MTKVKPKQDTIPEAFDLKIRIQSTTERGPELRRILEAKKKKDKRKTLADTAEAIILEYGEQNNL